MFINYRILMYFKSKICSKHLIIDISRIYVTFQLYRRVFLYNLSEKDLCYIP